jgi:hypothetical protein
MIIGSGSASSLHPLDASPTTQRRGLRRQLPNSGSISCITVVDNRRDRLAGGCDRRISGCEHPRIVESVSAGLDSAAPAPSLTWWWRN